MKPTLETCEHCRHYTAGSRYIKARDGYCAKTDNDVRAWWWPCPLWERREVK